MTPAAEPFRVRTLGLDVPATAGGFSRRLHDAGVPVTAGGATAAGSTGVKTVSPAPTLVQPERCPP